jgi:hypothetical protein
LAALADNFTGIVNPNTEGYPDKRNIYGVSKREFDDWIFGQTEVSCNICAIYPASILGKSHRSSSLHKLIDLHKSIFILRFISFPGIISFCERFDIFRVVINCIESTAREKIVVANNVSIRNVRMALGFKFSIQSFPFIAAFLKRFSCFIPWTIFRPLRSLFSQVIYCNENQDVRMLDKDSLRKYF